MNEEHQIAFEDCLHNIKQAIEFYRKGIVDMKHTGDRIHDESMRINSLEYIYKNSGVGAYAKTK